MFAKTIIDSDAFLDMPLSTQALYFHLSMRADDDGFINNPKKIQRMIGASEDDLKLLIAKRFIIPFESGIVVIKHWRIHNYIQRDRYKETVYKEEKALLSLKENNAYTLDTSCIQNVSSLEAQDRLGKNSIGKDNNILCDSDAVTECNADVTDCVTNDNESKSKSKYNNTELREEFEECWKLYPKKQGSKDKAFEAYKKARAEGTTKADVLIGINNFKAYVKFKGIEDQYIPYGQTFFCQKRWENDYGVKEHPGANEHPKEKHNAFNDFEQHDYDWDQLERDLLGYDC